MLKIKKFEQDITIIRYFPTSKTIILKQLKVYINYLKQKLLKKERKKEIGLDYYLV